MTNLESRFTKLERKLVLSDSRFGKIGAAKSFRLQGTLRDSRFPGGKSDEAPPPVQVSSTYFSTNKAPEPTITSVTPPAGAGVAPAALVAHL